MLSKAIPAAWNLTAERYSKATSLHVSVLAGITLESFKQRLTERLEVLPNSPYNLRCIRTMPNIAASVDSGCVVFTPEPDCLDDDRKFVQNFFGPTGIFFEVPETQMNAYSGLMGCGIGFMFPVIEALSDGAVKMGIPRATSLKLAAQVMKGAGELLLAENIHPGALKDRVCSPGGSTICGVAALEENRVRNAFIKAVEASTKRGEELGKLK
jgi:pyrroline-5-carboxylate reductase